MPPSPYLISIADKPDTPVLLDLGNDSDTLVVTFASLGGAAGVSTFEFFSSIFLFDVDKIFLRDMSTSWYLKGLRGMGISFPETVEYLKEQIALRQYKHVVFMGYSMGGFAAIAHGVLAGADTVLSFGPQTFVDAENRKRYGDVRWAKQMANIPAHGDRRLQDLKVLLDSVFYRSRIQVYHAVGYPIDQVHAQHIAACRNVELHACGEGGHLFVQEMKKSGQLYRIVRDALLVSSEDRMLSVWKDQLEIGTGAALQRHAVDEAEFVAYTRQHQDVVSARQAVLKRFFASIDAYIPQHFGLACVNARVPRHLCHCSQHIRSWFTADKRQFFGSFFALPYPGWLLHVELGTRNLHIGIVKSRSDEQGALVVLPMQEADFAAILQAYASGLPPTLAFSRRNWGPHWCSVDCGRFDDPEMYGTYNAMASFARSSLCKRIFTPFVNHIAAAPPA